MKTFLNDLKWTPAVSLASAALLTLADAGAGEWWIGWLSAALLFFLGLTLLVALWRWARPEQGTGASRRLAWMLILAFLLRFGLGVALHFILPVAGSADSVSQNAGYVFLDSYRRDRQAWELAGSSQPLWAAFDKSYAVDQYGGMLALSAWVYRYLSPDLHRPLLIVLIGAFSAAAGVALSWRTVQKAWNERAATLAAWILVLYPESLILGSSQTREPFLMTFIAMAFWGLADWMRRQRRVAWLWIAAGMAGLLLFNASMAIYALLVLAGWAWLGDIHRRLSWRVVLIALGVLLLGVVLLWLAAARGPFAGASPLQILTGWLQASATYETHLLEQQSSWIQRIFEQLPESLHLPFITGYGIAQPVLPAVLVDPTVWPWKVINILLSAGWYALLPFLAFSLVPAIKQSQKSERRVWLWFWVATWVWILLSSFRAGGDQWDNPRYRVVFLFLQALLAAEAWIWWREMRNPWFGRILAVEGVFVGFFLYWYIARYTGWSQGQVHFFVIAAAILGVSLLILIGGWLWDFLRQRRKKRA